MKPHFITELRKKIGRKRLQLISVSGVALSDDGKVLLQLRTDTNTWAAVSGVVEPDEQPAETLRREFLEETGTDINILGMASVYVEPEQTYGNGDVAQFLNITFLVKLLGEPTVHDQESRDIQWHSLDNLPQLSTQNIRRIQDCQRFSGNTTFINPSATEQ